MKIIAVICLLFTSLYSSAQVDAIKIASAKKALENKDYTIAIQTLSDVSDKGKKNKLYLFYKGEALYNLMDYDSAEVYYKKYLLLDVNNADVAEKLADIDYKKNKAESVKLENERKRVENENCIKNCTQCKGTGLYIRYFSVNCEKCNGKGERCWSSNLTGKCKTCKGTGQMAMYNKFTQETKYMDCPNCDASGKCDINHKCAYCKGTGKVRKEQNSKCYHPSCH